MLIVRPEYSPATHGTALEAVGLQTLTLRHTEVNSQHREEEDSQFGRRNDLVHMLTVLGSASKTST